MGWASKKHTSEVFGGYWLVTSYVISTDWSKWKLHYICGKYASSNSGYAQSYGNLVFETAYKFRYGQLAKGNMHLVLAEDRKTNQRVACFRNFNSKMLTLYFPLQFYNYFTWFIHKPSLVMDRWLQQYIRQTRSVLGYRLMACLVSQSFNNLTWDLNANYWFQTTLNHHSMLPFSEGDENDPSTLGGWDRKITSLGPAWVI